MRASVVVAGQHTHANLLPQTNIEIFRKLKCPAALRHSAERTGYAGIFGMALCGPLGVMATTPQSHPNSLEI